MRTTLKNIQRLWNQRDRSRTSIFAEQAHRILMETVETEGWKAAYAKHGLLLRLYQEHLRQCLVLDKMLAAQKAAEADLRRGNGVKDGKRQPKGRGRK